MTNVAIALLGTFPLLIPSCTLPASTKNDSPALYVTRRLTLIVERDGALEHVNHRGPRMRVPPLAPTDGYFDGDKHRFKAWR